MGKIELTVFAAFLMVGLVSPLMIRSNMDAYASRYGSAGELDLVQPGHQGVANFLRAVFANERKGWFFVGMTAAAAFGATLVTTGKLAAPELRFFTQILNEWALPLETSGDRASRGWGQVLRLLLSVALLGGVVGWLQFLMALRSYIRLPQLARQRHGRARVGDWVRSHEPEHYSVPDDSVFDELARRDERRRKRFVEDDGYGDAEEVPKRRSGETQNEGGAVRDLLEAIRRELDGPEKPKIEILPPPKKGRRGRPD